MISTQVLDASGRGADALAHVREAHETLEAAEGSAHADTVAAAIRLARLLAAAAGSVDELRVADPILTGAFDAQRRAHGAAHSACLATLAHLVPVRVFVGDLAGARELATAGVAGLAALFGPEAPAVRRLETYLGLVCALEDDVETGRPMVERAAAASGDGGLAAAAVLAALVDDGERAAVLDAAAAKYAAVKLAQQVAFLRLRLVPLAGEFHRFCKALKAGLQYVELDLKAGILDPEAKPRGVL